ncbi:MAG: serine O-acetyltransferase EpsC [Bacteroidales bacterium]
MTIDYNERVIQAIDATVDQLSMPQSYEQVYHKPLQHEEMLSIDSIREIMEIVQEILFPGYFGNASIKPHSMRFHMGVNVDQLLKLLMIQIKRGYCFDCTAEDCEACDTCKIDTESVSLAFIQSLPEIREKLSKDVKAMYMYDPAAKGYGEIIFAYPGIKALTYYRVAHRLYELQVPIIPRIISEMAHSATGIDIHPGAQIGESFVIDHGTGVVIGETSIIGNNVRIYQGVTLGARSFKLDNEGNPMRGLPRHPIVEDDVVIYSGATILGRVTIGKGSIIGGNVWITQDLPPYSKVVQGRPRETLFEFGGGI